MSSYALTPLAKADIFNIWSYIAEDNENAADRVEQAIFAACEFLAEAPLRGHSRSDLTTRSLRFWTLTRYPNYSLVYRPETTPLQIVAVLHGKRNAQRILKQRA
jgi:plasmid stabilization system protein ParE